MARAAVGQRFSCVSPLERIAAREKLRFDAPQIRAAFFEKASPPFPRTFNAKRPVIGARVEATRRSPLRLAFAPLCWAARKKRPSVVFHRI